MTIPALLDLRPGDRIVYTRWRGEAGKLFAGEVLRVGGARVTVRLDAGGRVRAVSPRYLEPEPDFVRKMS